jgi:hypothetical protein
MSDTVPLSFDIDAGTLASIDLLISEMAERSRYTTVQVPAVDFPAWLAALGADEFHSHSSEMREGGKLRLYQRVQSNILRRGEAMFSVTSEGLPSTWVTFPEPGAVNYYQFAAVAR